MELTEGFSSIVVNAADVKEFSCNDTQAIIDEKVRQRQEALERMIASRDRVVDSYELIANKKLLTKNEKSMIPIIDD